MEKKTQGKELERRRLKAGPLLLKGVPQAEVARKVGVAESTVSGWNARLEQHGLDGLRATGRHRWTTQIGSNWPSCWSKALWQRTLPPTSGRCRGFDPTS